MEAHTTSPTQMLSTTTATTTITTATSTAASSQISIYGHPSPANSATATPTNNSPTSPRMTTAAVHQFPLQSRQLRKPKSPLYVPAVLRPTERSHKPSPLTPPRSVHGSLDSLNDGDTSMLIRRQSTADSTKSGISKLAEDEWMKGEDLGEVTGDPKRDHWRADSASPNCDSPTCRSSFGLFLRRHHCRHCGHVFCSSHTADVVPLDQNARFHPDGVLSRACDLCWTAYLRWEESRTARLNKIQRMLDAQSQGIIAGLNIDPTAHPIEIWDHSPDGNQPAESVASNSPRDWNWSTF